MQQALAREMPVVDPNSSMVANKSAAKNIIYDPQSGSKLFWDYAVNLPRKAKGSNLARTRYEAARSERRQRGANDDNEERTTTMRSEATRMRRFLLHIKNILN